MPVAFFDLDKTIIAENSAKLWLAALWQQKRIKPIEMLRASYWLTKYHLGFTKLDNVILKSLSLFKGEQASIILEETTKFFFAKLRNLYRPGALAVIEKHRQQGTKVALLTSSFDGLAMLVQNDLKLDYCLSTTLEVDNQGLYTGKTIGFPCFGTHKVTYAQELCNRLKISLQECTFYTDSASDMPLLLQIGRAVAVNPDPHLRAQARLRRWDIVDWGKPYG